MEGGGFQIWRAAANVLNNQSRIVDKGWSSSLWLVGELTTPHRERPISYGMLHRKDEMGGACSAHGGDVKCVQNFFGKPEGKRPLGRPRRRWEDNIKIEWGNGVGGCGLVSSGLG
jgi:hypothetical protein